MGNRGCGCSVLLTLLAIWIVGEGFIHISEAWRYKAPRTLTFDQFAEQKPTEGWFRISGGILSVPEAIHLISHNNKYSYDDEQWGRIYIPLRTSTPAQSHSDKPFTPVRVLVETSKEDVVKLHAEYVKEQPASSGTFDREKWFLSRDVEGMVGNELHSADADETKALLKLVPNLRSGCVQLDEGAQPNMSLGIKQVVGGCALGFLMLLAFVGNRRNRG